MQFARHFSPSELPLEIQSQKEREKKNRKWNSSVNDVKRRHVSLPLMSVNFNVVQNVIFIYFARRLLRFRFLCLADVFALTVRRLAVRVLWMLRRATAGRRRLCLHQSNQKRCERNEHKRFSSLHLLGFLFVRSQLTAFSEREERRGKSLVKTFLSIELTDDRIKDSTEFFFVAANTKMRRSELIGHCGLSSKKWAIIAHGRSLFYYRSR